MNSQNGHSIAVIAGRKKTDALLCTELAKHFPNLTIIQYQIPITQWIPWVLHRIVDLGFGVFIGHLFLSLSLRLQQKIELIRKQSLWLTCADSVPSWGNVHARKISCFREASLLQNVRDADALLLLDSFRLSHTFYRRMKKPCLQVIWGKTPMYLGDSAGFWAFAHGEKDEVGVSVIQRTHQFNRFTVLAEKIVVCKETEDLRSIKIHQACAMADLLPHVVQTLLAKKSAFVHNRSQETQCRIFTAPTLSTYRRFLKEGKLAALPAYASKVHQCFITRL